MGDAESLSCLTVWCAPQDVVEKWRLGDAEPLSSVIACWFVQDGVEEWRLGDAESLSYLTVCCALQGGVEEWEMQMPPQNRRQGRHSSKYLSLLHRGMELPDLYDRMRHSAAV